MYHKLLVIVPARGGSKRLPGKNLRVFGGKPLLAHTADAICQSALDVTVLLSTDDDAIAEEGKRLGWQVPFRRPAALSTDDAATIDVVLHALEHFTSQSGHRPELVLVLQPTSPLRGGGCIRAALDLLGSRGDADAVIGMSALNLPPSHLFFAGTDGVAEAVSSDRRCPVYVPNGALYLARVPALLELRSLYLPRLLPLVMDDIRSLDIDTEIDWRLAEAALAAGLPAETVALATASVAPVVS
jgi:CMP-N,N'-diacetyllegionaminic acid synthase